MGQRAGGQKFLVLAVVLAVAGAGCAWAWPHLIKPNAESTAEKPKPAPKAELVAGATNVLRVPNDVVQTMGLLTAPVVAATPPPPLKLDGWLILDPSRLVHVRTRFDGEVVEIGKIEGVSDEPSSQPQRCIRELRFGDEVKKGQLMAVVWSKELGEKKSELVDVLSRLHLHQETAKRLEDLYRKGAVPERSVREAEQNVDADEIAIVRAKRTLSTWRLSEADIDEIEAEANRIRELQSEQTQDTPKNWARVEIRAASDGVIVERNIAVGVVVNTQLDMFKIADLKRLEVLAHVYEDDLPLIEDRADDNRRWNIYLKSDSLRRPLEGRFDQIGPIIDSSQHTALVMGWVDNSEGRLRVGQFITATIALPAPPDAVTVPLTALIDQGGKYRVFVQMDPTKPEFTARTVTPVGHGAGGTVYISTHSPESTAAGAGNPPHLSPGEHVVTSGGLEMAAALDEMAEAVTLASQPRP